MVPSVKESGHLPDVSVLLGLLEQIVMNVNQVTMATLAVSIFLIHSFVNCISSGHWLKGLLQSRLLLTHTLLLPKFRNQTQHGLI